MHWPFQIDQERRCFWKQTCGLLERPRMWMAIETAVCRMRDGEITQESNLQEFLSDETE